MSPDPVLFIKYDVFIVSESKENNRMS